MYFYHYQSEDHPQRISPIIFGETLAGGLLYLAVVRVITLLRVVCTGI
jgi:hypothetical protein